MSMIFEPAPPATRSYLALIDWHINCMTLEPHMKGYIMRLYLTVFFVASIVGTFAHARTPNLSKAQRMLRTMKLPNNIQSYQASQKNPRVFDRLSLNMKLTGATTIEVQQHNRFRRFFNNLKPGNFLRTIYFKSGSTAYKVIERLDRNGVKVVEIQHKNKFEKWTPTQGGFSVSQKERNSPPVRMDRDKELSVAPRAGLDKNATIDFQLK